MSPEEYLQQAYRLNNRIHSELREIEALRETATSVRVPVLGDRVQTSRSTDPPFVRTLEKIEELEEKMNAEVKLLIELREQIAGVIDSVADPDKRMTLRYRYINGMTWKEIGYELNVDERTARRWHSAVIKEIVLPADLIMI